MRKTILGMLLGFGAVVGSVSAQQKVYFPTTPMPTARQMYGAVVLGDYLYLIGGNTDEEGFLVSVQKSLIKSDGHLGAWEATTPLPRGRAYIENCTMALNDIVYVVAGYEGTVENATNTIFWTRPKTDGHFEPWRESAAYPGEGIYCSAAVATSGYIHLIAGVMKPLNPSALVWSAQVGADGGILGWEPGPELPFPLWYHSAGVAGGRVWVWGGLKDKSPKSASNTVLCAPILSSGKLGPWMVYPQPLPMPLYSASSTVSGSYLLSFCPRYAGAQVSNDIWYAYIYPQGLSTWSRVPTDIPSKLYIGLATDYRRGNVYIPGGRLMPKERQMDNTVYVVRLMGQQAAAEPHEDTAQEAELSSVGHGADRLSYMQQTLRTDSAFSGFLSFEQAQRSYGQNKMPIIAYLHSEKAQRCQQQAEQLQKFNATAHAGKILFTEVNTAAFPQIAQQTGVFRVPTWLFYDARGVERLRKTGVLTTEELDTLSRQLAEAR